MKQCEEIRKLTTDQREGYTTGCLLDYEYIKHYYRLITVDLSRQKGLDVGRKPIQKIEFVWKLKNPADVIVADEPMFLLTILEKNQRNEIEFFLRKRNSLIKDGELWRSKS